MLHHLCKQAFYSRICNQMKHRESIFKENIDIKRVLARGSVPFLQANRERLQNNKQKIGLFLAFCGVLSLNSVYTCIVEGINYQSAYLIYPALALKGSYVNGQSNLKILSQYGKLVSRANQLKRELLAEFLKIDREFNYGFSRRLMVKAFKEMALAPSKENRTEFYRSSGTFERGKAKLATINIKELEYIIRQTFEANKQKFSSFEAFQDRFLESLHAAEHNERQHQQKKFLQRTKHFFDSITKKSLTEDLDKKDSNIVLPLRLKYEMLKANTSTYVQRRVNELRQEMKALNERNIIKD